jgi:hypothetical protein
MRRLVEKAVVVSPLPNLAAAAGNGATLRHVRPLRAIGDSGLTGMATLSLTPDRRWLSVSVTLDRPRAATVRLRRLGALRCAGAGTRDEDLLVVEIVASRWPGSGICPDRRFSLERRHCRGVFAETEELLSGGVRSDELSAGSVAGIFVEAPRVRRRPAGGAGGYFASRMLAEIAAAESSATAVGTARHVEMATLYARRLGEQRML